MNNDDLDHLDAEAASPRIRPDAAPAQERRSERSYQLSHSSDRGVHLLDYVRVFYKRRWLATTVFVLIFGTVILHTLTATTIYEAQTRLLIESDERNVVSFQQVVDEDQTKADYYQTQYNILRSRALARKTLDALSLWENPHFGGRAAEEGISLWSPIKGMFLSSSDDKVAKNAIPGADETQMQSHAIDAFLSRLAVTPIRNSRLVDVRYQLPDAQLATSVVNSLAANYIEQNLEYKFLASKEASDWLGERLAEQRQQVESAQLALQLYRERNDAISLEASENIVVQKLGDLNAAVTRAKTERIEKEALYNQLRASQSTPAALDTFPAVMSNGFIQQQKSELALLQREQAQLREKLGDKHPDMQRLAAAIQLSQSKLDGEIAKVVQSVRSEYQSALAQENSLTAALNQQKSEALAMNRKAIDYGVLERDVESTRQIYDSLMQRSKETSVAGELRSSNIRVVDPAERPRSPIAPKTRRDITLGLLGAFLLSCTMVFFFEYLDSGIKTPDDVKTHLGLPNLGLLPSITDKETGGYPVLSKGVPANFGEALRTARTNLLFSMPEDGPKTVAVTSTGPGEGKSMVASNLAVSLAQTGQSVLIVDADLRKPRMQDVFEISQEPGLSNLLVGKAKASECVRKSGVPGLWVMPAGRLAPNPAELLASQKFRELLVSLKGHFDWVIIDTPPVMAVTDASLVAHCASAVLFVVGAEMISRHAASRALDQLEQSQARLIGVVLNRVDLERNPYYYSHYYRREYAQYYLKS